ncbi:MAG TPA: lysine--tRNA ligase [bacterium (Candidatus Stahlbacteria)]|nr:lysine--tRNA ligase [Candidatus Stahlbacteria bacterium]
MFDTEQEKRRIEKLKKLKERGIEPYPYSFNITHKTKDIINNFERLNKSETQVNTAGRVTAIREHGKTTFLNINDVDGKIQVYFRKDVIGDKKYDILKLLDIGDFIGVRGSVFKTHTGEITILVNDYELLAKALHPLPEKWHGLQDKEERYRKRWLDLLMNQEVKVTFLQRTELINKIRQFLNARGFVEVDTPTLQPLYGGAFAKPFKAHYDALDRDFYLRISDELYLKRLIIGGFEKVYEICKDFRNEGMDRFHNPEFTMLELYEAYKDYYYLMDLVEELFDWLLLEIKGKRELEFDGKRVEFKRPWNRLPFFKALEEFVGRDLRHTGREELLSLATELDISLPSNVPKGKIWDTIFDKLVQPNIIEPTFVIDYPKDVSPLTKQKRDDPDLVERFEPIIFGIEIGNAFSELNDPLEQYERFKQQEKFRKEGESEAQVLDEDFISALEIGMPPTAGLGLGIDRIVMMFTNSHSIKDVIMFPQMRV